MYKETHTKRSLHTQTLADTLHFIFLYFGIIRGRNKGNVVHCLGVFHEYRSVLVSPTLSLGGNLLILFPSALFLLRHF